MSPMPASLSRHLATMDAEFGDATTTKPLRKALAENDWDVRRALEVIKRARVEGPRSPEQEMSRYLNAERVAPDPIALEIQRLAAEHGVGEIEVLHHLRDQGEDLEALLHRASSSRFAAQSSMGGLYQVSSLLALDTQPNYTSSNFAAQSSMGGVCQIASASAPYMANPFGKPYPTAAPVTSVKTTVASKVHTYAEIEFAYYTASIFDNERAFFGILKDKGITTTALLAAKHLEQVIPSGFRPSAGTREVFYGAVWGRLFELHPRAVILTELKEQPQQSFNVTAQKKDFLVGFVESAPNWDICKVTAADEARTTGVENYLGRSRQRTRAAEALDWMGRLQRTLALTRGHTVEATSAVMELMRSRYGSAQSIAAISAGAFADAFPYTRHPKATWLAIHNRASRIRDCTVCVADALYNTARASGMAVLDGPHGTREPLPPTSAEVSRGLKDVNLTELFHDLDSESCDDCNSVTCPAAYFVELLQFLRNNNIQEGHTHLSSAVGGTPLGHLLARRPDLENLELTCANTTVLLPYLDLANEAMESYVVHDTTEVFNNRARGSEALAEPEHTNIEAYRPLSQQVYPFSKLPYHQPLDEVRIFLKHLKTSRYELLEAMNPRTTGDTTRAKSAEYLNLTLSEYCAITGETGALQEHNYWGYQSTSGLDAAQKKDHHGPGGLLARSGLALTDLAELLNTAFINPDVRAGTAIVIFLDNPKVGCIRLTHLNETELVTDDWKRIRCFTQLWRKTGWRMRELDQAISGLDGAKRITANLLQQIVAVMKLVELTGLTPDVLLPFWSPIDTRPAKDSLYTRLFLSHHIDGIDSVFANGNWLLPESIIKISDHETAVEATLGLTKEGLDAIKAKISGSDSDALSIANMSTLYRHGVLAKLLRITPAVLLHAITLFGKNPFQDATSCLAFIELWKQMETAGLSFAQLRYALTGTNDALKPLGPSKVALDRVTESIAGSLRGAGELGLKAELSDVHAGHVTVELIFNTLSEAHGVSTEILRELLLHLTIQTLTPEIRASLARAAIFITGFNLCAAEVNYLLKHLNVFSTSSTISKFSDLLAYIKLRDSLPKVADAHHHPLLDILLDSSITRTTLAQRIADLLVVAKAPIGKLLEHFVLEEPQTFRGTDGGVASLTTLKNALGLADGLGADVGQLIEWFGPREDFDKLHTTARQIRGTMRGRSSAEDWEKTIKPLRDQLRHRQRDALIAFLSLQPALVKWGVVDEDSLFEYFLIDVKMGACLQTSRIVQAISTVQLFVQRCFYGLEERHGGVKGSHLDRKRWEWMKHYRTWEANRMVFLYPENWLDPSLRDNKSPFFLELESELMQSDLNTQTIEEAVQNYKSRVERVANLQDVARCSEGSGVSAKIHYFARSPGSPFAYYYQMYDGAEKEWKPWAVMPMEVQTHEDQRLAELRAMTLLPVVMGGRLIVFTPQTVKRLSGVGVPDKEAIHKTQHNLEIKLGWSELQKNNKWTAKQVSPMSFRTPNSTGKTKVVMSVRNPGSGSVGIAVAAYTSQNGGGSLTGPKSTAFTFSNGSIEAHDGSKDRGNVHEFREAETVRAAIAAENVRNAVYDWEDGLHIPLLLMDKLASSHQYEKALEMAHRVFDPMCASGTDITAVWKWHPFKQKTTIPDQIQEILSHLKANTPAPKVDHWRDKPFRPHVVARERPVAYKRWVVVRYIEILIASGDRLFRQNTMESVPLAIQYYTLASHLYGPPGTTIPECRRNANPKTFRSLLSGWDAFSNALVQLETAFPFHRHTECSTQRTVSPVRTGPFFCVPRNTRLRDLRATIDDRLYKIRHCQDINGARLTRSLFEAPIDPGAMVRAAAQGLSVDNVLGHAGGPMPNYRFRYLLQTAFEMVQELKALGGEFLAAKEKKDAHAYELIRNGHGRIIQTMVMDMKKLSRDEAAKVLESLKKARTGPFARLNHYSQLIGEDIKQFADLQTFSTKLPAFKPIECGIQAPLSDDKLKLSVEEKSEIDYAGKATILRISSKTTDAAAAALLMIPQFKTAAHPFGIGISTSVGTRIAAEGLRAAACGMAAAADDHDGSSVHASRKAGLIRQFQERVLQANSAGYELEVLDTQIATHMVRMAIVDKDILLQQKQIDTALAEDNFLRTMYTSTELYSWQEKQLRTLYYQAYTVAYDLAQKVEKAFNYERGQTGPGKFIKTTWDANKDGLFSGEALGLGLRQLEAVYQQTRGHDFEIAKHVSLRQLDPMALLELQQKSACTFKLPEVLFDVDFPGHLNRRLKSVSLSLPCVVGPYTSTNCTLELTNHKYRVTSDTDLIAGGDPPIKSIAVSSGLNDAGMFELNFNDERYLPFEGAGAISEWKLSLPEFAAFDYRTISDAILHLRYTSMPGDPSKRKTEITSHLSGNQTALFDLPNELATAWHQRGNRHPMSLHPLAARLPWRHQGKTITVTGIKLLTSQYGGITPGVFAMTGMTDGGVKEVVFASPESVGKLEMFTGKVESWTGNGFGTVKGFTDLKLAMTSDEPKDLWMLVTYKST